MRSMKKTKAKAFSLIEVVIAMAIITLLSTLVTPQVRTQLAKGKDTKAISCLSTLRTAAQMYHIENDKSLITKENYDNPEAIKKALQKLKGYLNEQDYAILSSGSVEIGGSRTAADGSVNYGGKIGFSFKNPNTEEVSGDGSYIWFKPEGEIGAYDTRGVLWTSY